MRRGIGLAAAVAAAAAALVAMGFAPAKGVRNAGVTWACNGICTANVDGSGRRLIFPTHSDGEGDPTWTRDGRALAFEERFSDTVEIHYLRAGTHRDVKLGYGYAPAWSPGGRRIAAETRSGDCSSIDGVCVSTIQIVSLATKKWRPVTKVRRGRWDTEPAWAPDGRTIAFTRRVRDLPTLYLVRPDGSSLRRLVRGHSPSWSPDGRRLAFVLHDSIYEIRADGGGRRRVLRGVLGFRGVPPPVVRWSPDGRKLLYVSWSGGNCDIWTADVDGSHRRRILHGVRVQGDEGIVAWRPGR